MTTQLYLEDTYLFESDAHIIECKDDNNAQYILLDKTIFYPQGGGQPCDHGKIFGDNFEYLVRNVKQVGDEIRHYTDPTHDYSIFQNCAVKCVIDKDRRLLNAQYHTAGHLLGNIVESNYKSLKALKCHAFSNEAYIEFYGTEIPEEQFLQGMLQKTIEADIKTKTFEIDQDLFELTYYKLPYEIPGDKKFRALQIGGYLPVPCGGTHVSSTKEIGSITLNKIKQKNETLKISFVIT